MRIALYSKNSHVPLLIAVITVISLLGCADSKLPKYYQLDGARILALQADLPEVAALTTVTITPLVTDVNGNGRTLTYVAEGCYDPGTAFGATATCDHDSTKTQTTGSITFTDSRRTGTAPTFSITPPAAVLAGRSTSDQFNGVAYLVVYKVTAGSDTITAFRRIIVSTKTPKNLNPALSSVTSDGNPISTLPIEQKEIGVKVSAGAESFISKDADLSERQSNESITVSWFISNGQLKLSRTDGDSKNFFSPPVSASRTPNFLVVVIRDSRGGVSFLGVPSL